MSRLLLFIKVISILFVTSQCIIVGPKAIASQGEVWPQATELIKGNTIYKLSPTLFFKETGKTCNILKGAIHRYQNVLRSTYDLAFKLARRMQSNATVDAETVLELQINLTAPCEKYPHLEMDEKYSLKVSAVSTLNSDSIWGILRGLETFVQLFYISEIISPNIFHPEVLGYAALVKSTQITDQPKYPHRGLLIDTARHYLSVPTILKILDGMEMNKMNVLHWHMVDDESFPYESQVLPELSKAAYFPTMVYTADDISRIRKYAKNRGIRVIPEFNMPGGTDSWGVAFPNITTTCYLDDKKSLVLLDPTKNETYKVISDLIHEVQQRFPDEYINIGGDAGIEYECLESIPHIKKYMRENGISMTGLLFFNFMEKVFPLLGNSKLIVWQEVFERGFHIPNGTIIHYRQRRDSYMNLDIKNMLQAGHKVLVSTGTKLQELFPYGHFINYIPSDPRFAAGWKDAKGILGSVAIMWGSMVDDNTVISRIWPQASGVAQRLWNGKQWQSEEKLYNPTRENQEIAQRIEEHTCRMKRRGVHGLPPNGPGFCITE